MGSFDIRDALTGRNYVTTHVPFWIDDQIFYEIAMAQDKHNAVTDPADIAERDRELAALEKRRDEEAYTVYLRAISNRANEDIISKALAEFPIKRDVYGREDENVALERGKLIRELQVAAHITKIVDPEGNAQPVDDENRRNVARVLIDNAPPISLNVLDQAIQELNKKFNAEQFKQQDTDFLSKH